MRTCCGVPLTEGFEQREALALKLEAATDASDADGLA